MFCYHYDCTYLDPLIASWGLSMVVFTRPNEDGHDVAKSEKTKQMTLMNTHTQERSSRNVYESVSGSNEIPDFEPHCHRKSNIGGEELKNFQYNNEDYEAPEPFSYLNNCCDDCLPIVDVSPDPLISVTWNDTLQNWHHDRNSKMSANKFVGTPLQIYRTRTPVRQWTIPAEGCLVSIDPAEKPIETHRVSKMKIVSNCTIVMDWGSERAAWFEILSRDDLSEGNPNVKVTGSISEYNRPYPGKTLPFKKYGNRTYRLETNDELYEGVRFTFLHVDFFDTATKEVSNPKGQIAENCLIIDDVSIVAKIKPISYTGKFHSSNHLLTKAYYWGAYGVRLNIEQSQLNSVLIERGDRVAIQGDGHPTIATILDVFYGQETKNLLKSVLNDTDNAHKRVVDDVIMAYPLYWCLSAMDYYWRSYTDDDKEFVRTTILEDIPQLLDKRIQDFLDPDLDITWFGWDDRVGNGWCFHSKNDACTEEGLLAFAGLVIGVCNEFCSVLESMMTTKDIDPEILHLHSKYRTASIRMTRAMRKVPEYPSGLGLHAVANIINAMVATTDEIEEYWMGTSTGKNILNNAVTVCSFSQFNQYWILQAYGKIRGGLEHALKSIELCWGPMMELSTGGCFWELSSREWLRFMKEGDQAPHLPSYCHPWASGVTPWLSRFLGGINPLLPGYEEFVAMPYVSEAYPNVSTSVLTPHGPISISLRLTAANTTKAVTSRKLFQIHATVDSSVSGIFGIQRSFPVSSLTSNVDQNAFLHINTLLVNKVPICNEDIVHTIRSKAGIDESQMRAGRLNEIGGYRTQEYIFIQLKNLNTGPQDITGIYMLSDDVDVNYSGSKPNIYSESRVTTTTISGGIQSYNPFPKPKYAARLNDYPFDRESKGDGLKTYGSDGYLLIGYGNDFNVDARVTSLPSYVHSLQIRQHGYPGWVLPKSKVVGYSDTDSLYLPLENADPNGARFLGSVGIEDNGGGDINCILVDVTIDHRPTYNQDWKNDSKHSFIHQYSLSIYFVADRPENRHAIRVMDGETFDLIAPTTVVEDYQGGVWWTVRYDRSIRLKMMDIEGIHLSAVAFATNHEGEDGPFDTS